MEATSIGEGELVQNLESQQDEIPSIHYLSFPTVGEVSLGCIYDVYGIVTALNVSAMLWNVFLLCIKDHLYMSNLLNADKDQIDKKVKGEQLPAEKSSEKKNKVQPRLFQI